MYRCINDVFGYCSKIPNGEKQGEDDPGIGQQFKFDSCTEDPKTCQNYKSLSQTALTNALC